MESRQWLWMMNWCKKKGLPPASSAVWNMAKNAYERKTQKNH